MAKLIAVIIIILLIGGYFWYVRGVEIGPIIQKIKSIHISITFDEERGTEQITQDSTLGIWETLPEMPTSRTEVAVAALGNTIFVIGGFDGFGRTVNTVEVFNTETKDWSTHTPLPAKVHHAGLVVLNDKLYVVGGFSGLNFDPIDSVWTLDKEEGWVSLKSLPKAMGAMAVVAFDTAEAGIENTRIYTFGGVGKEGLSDQVYAYNPTLNEWATMKKMPTAREHFSGIAIEDKIYAVGGRKKSIRKNLDDLEIFFPLKNIWAIGPSMPTDRGGIASAAVNGKLYVFGGEDPVGTFDVVEEYNPETKDWNTMNPMPTARHGLGAAVVDGKIYVIGGGKRPLLSVSKLNEAFTPPQEKF